MSQDSDDLGVKIQIETEHLRFVNCSVPVCRQVSHFRLLISMKVILEITFSTGRLQLLTMEHGDEVVNFVATSNQSATGRGFGAPNNE